MIGLHSQSGPTVVYSKGVILPPWDYIVSPWDFIVFSNVYDNSSKLWINNEQLCHYCIILDVYVGRV